MNEQLKRQMNTLMYHLTKNAARQSFSDFLSDNGISYDEYNEIKKEWEKIGITDTYV